MTEPTAEQIRATLAKQGKVIKIEDRADLPADELAHELREAGFVTAKEKG